MYIMVQDFASPGEYVVHKKTGEILPVMFVGDMGSAVISEWFDMDCTGCGPKYIEWSFNDYFVLRKVADMYFGSDFRVVNR
jgi:hypothetical protein